MSCRALIQPTPARHSWIAVPIIFRDALIPHSRGIRPALAILLLAGIKCQAERADGSRLFPRCPVLRVMASVWGSIMSARAWRNNCTAPLVLQA
jgi:hypothetical protein